MAGCLEMDDPVLLLLKLIRDNWTETDPAKANIDFRLENPDKDKTAPQLCAMRPAPEQYFTTGQRRTSEDAMDIGANPTRYVREAITVIVAVKRVGSANISTVLVTRWEMIEEIRRIIKTYGATVTGVKHYALEGWQHDDFKEFDPTFALSRSTVVAKYFK